MAKGFIWTDDPAIEITDQTLRNFERRWTDAIRAETSTEERD